MSSALPLYQKVANRIEELVAGGVYEPGERLPSIRELHREFRISINTAREVYRLLESRGVVEPKNHSGHFVLEGPPLCTDCEMDFPDFSTANPQLVSAHSLTRQVLREGAQTGWINLGTAEPPAALLPTQRLAELTARGLRRHPREAVAYSLAPGPLPLRQEIAKRIFRGGVTVSPEQVLVTAGCLEAVFLSLMTVCTPGDAVVIESPGFYLFYQLLERLGLRAIELPSRPGSGIDPSELDAVLRQAQTAHRRGRGPRVAAALLIANFSNPVGSLLLEEHKREVAATLDRHDVYLIEDDMYGEMAWDVDRPSSLASYVDPERSLLCASFSKSIAPGYRIGWLTAGRSLVEGATHSKLVTSAAVSGPAALGISEFLAHGGYDRWLRRARGHYRVAVDSVRRTIHYSFPSGTRSTRPAGGMVVWVAMPPGYDSVALYSATRKERITFAPGPIFSLGGSYRNCLRVNATGWSPEVERALRRIGQLACEIGATE